MLHSKNFHGIGTGDQTVGFLQQQVLVSGS
jgi:hypothetical protein